MSLGNAAVQNKSFCCLCWIFLCGWINKLWFRSCCSCCLLVFWLNQDFLLESVVSLSEYYLVSSSCWVTISLRLILNWKTAQVSNFKYIFVYNQIIIGEFWGNSDFFSPYEILVLGNFAFFPSKFCLLYDLWLFLDSEFLGDFGLIWEWRLWLKILLFIEVPTIFKYSDFFLEFRPFRENYDLFGNSNTSGIFFSVRLLIYSDFFWEFSPESSG